MTREPRETRAVLARLARIGADVDSTRSTRIRSTTDSGGFVSRKQPPSGTDDSDATESGRADVSPTDTAHADVDAGETPPCGDPITVGAGAVRDGRPAVLVKGAERAAGDVSRVASFARAGGFAHLAGTVAASDDPVVQARGAAVLVLVADCQRRLRRSDRLLTSGGTESDDGSGLNLRNQEKTE